MSATTPHYLSEDATVVASNEQTGTMMPGQAVILNVKSGMYYAMDKVGARVWSLIQEPRTVKELHLAILEEYDVEPDRCWHDLLELLQELEANGLVELRNGKNASGR